MQCDAVSIRDVAIHDPQSPTGGVWLSFNVDTGYRLVPSDAKHCLGQVKRTDHTFAHALSAH